MDEFLDFAKFWEWLMVTDGLANLGPETLYILLLLVSDYPAQQYDKQNRVQRTGTASSSLCVRIPPGPVRRPQKKSTH